MKVSPVPPLISPPAGQQSSGGKRRQVVSGVRGQRRSLSGGPAAVPDHSQNVSDV